MPHVALLKHEAGHDTGVGRAACVAETGAHDDLVVAVALAVWWAWLG